MVGWRGLGTFERAWAVPERGPIRPQYRCRHHGETANFLSLVKLEYHGHSSSKWRGELPHDWWTSRGCSGGSIVALIPEPPVKHLHIVGGTVGRSLVPGRGPGFAGDALSAAQRRSRRARKWEARTAQLGAGKQWFSRPRSATSVPLDRLGGVRDRSRSNRGATRACVQPLNRDRAGRARRGEPAGESP